MFGFSDEEEDNGDQELPGKSSCPSRDQHIRSTVCTTFENDMCAQNTRKGWPHVSAGKTGLSGHLQQIR